MKLPQAYIYSHLRSRQLLRKHTDAHTASFNSFACLFCPKIFSVQENMYLHMEKEHTDSLEEAKALGVQFWRICHWIHFLCIVPLSWKRVPPNSQVGGEPILNLILIEGNITSRKEPLAMLLVRWWTVLLIHLRKGITSDHNTISNWFTS